MVLLIQSILESSSSTHAGIPCLYCTASWLWIQPITYLRYPCDEHSGHLGLYPLQLQLSRQDELRVERANTTLTCSHFSFSCPTTAPIHGVPQSRWPVPHIGFSHTPRALSLGRVLKHPSFDALQLQLSFQSAYHAENTGLHTFQLSCNVALCAQSPGTSQPSDSFSSNYPARESPAWSALGHFGLHSLQFQLSFQGSLSV